MYMYIYKVYINIYIYIYPMRTITGTMHGSWINHDIPGLTAWKLKNDIYVFFTPHGTNLKMTSIPLSVVEEASQATPASPGDRWVDKIIIPENVEILQELWDGTYPGYVTTIASQQGVYEMKNVVYNSWIDTPPVYTMAGLYTVDTALSEAEISGIASKMYLGNDTVQMCQTCPSNTVSLQGSTAVANCTSIESPSNLAKTRYSSTLVSDKEKIPVKVKDSFV